VKIVSSLLIIAFLNLTIGCTSFRSEKVYVNELDNSGDNVINVSINDSLFTFINKDAFYKQNPASILGYDIYNSYKNIPLDSIKSILEPNISIMQLDTAVIIKKMQLLNNTEIVFNSKGGKLSEKYFFIKGITKDSTTFSVKTNTIDYLTINKIDVTGVIVKNFFLVGGILVGALFVLAILIAKSFSGGLAG
jgi:hypothetical protein